ncbi:uncharacterized protein LOC129938564 [Eupeodes corollae]|uniref:uncharacterized protein LOC129938564 n=1 Tax=Eupeodes corollae TaxID=290404 RepID=UPI002493247A|nr:uncharacterized protein LOC129938564 [Eupeodes corollae]
MPKGKTSVSAVLKKYVSDNPQIFTSDGKILFCKICSKGVSYDKKFQVDQHLKSMRHTELSTLSNSTNSQQLLSFRTTQNNFNMDLCEAFVAADIPLSKLNNPSLRKFLFEYTKEIVPDSSTLRKNYINKMYILLTDKIKSVLKDEYIWISIDETTDIQGRFVANVVAGVLSQNEDLRKKVLLNVVELEKTNHSTIAQIFDETVNYFGIKKNKILLFLTDAAPYMIKAARGLKILYPKLIHVTCLAHALHRVAEQIRSNFKNVDLLISSGKKIFLKAPSRVENFKTRYPLTPLPPQPIVTRWGTWLEAVAYYAKNYKEFEDIVNGLDDSDAVAIKNTKEALKKPSLKSEIIFINSNYTFLCDVIIQLEGNNSLKKQVDLIETVVSKIGAVEGSFGVAIKEKLDNVLKKNEGFLQMKNICRAFSLSCVEEDYMEHLTPQEICSLKNAPLTSVDVERSFSMYKTFQRPNRQSFTFENLRKNFMIYANKAYENCEN